MKPKSYDLLLDVDFGASTFTGRAVIELQETAGILELDAAGLHITSVSVDAGNCDWNYDRSADRLTIKGAGFSSATLEFSGRAVEGGLHGFYKSKFKSGYFLSTQFEPVGARTLFPCVDHPSFKAVFRISVIVDGELTVISNSCVSAVEKLGERMKVVFEATPLMSTYLLFIGIGRFDEQTLENGFDVIVASSQEQRGKGRFGIENGRRFLKEYQDYYSLPYPMKKLHLLAIPEFAVGAMENWGAITFREAALLVDGTTTVSNRRLVALVIAHEIAHQWFGNLVTMKWWNDLWLNESFATYMSSVIVDKVYPDWEVWSDFLTVETNGAMVGDSLENTHPVEVEVKRPEEINQIFDEISYGKGASVLRMIAAYIGERSFREGVNAYLKRFAFGNAQSSDLWESLERASNEPVGMIMRQWIATPGFPVVTVTLDGKGVKVTQERFLLNGRDTAAKWPIPVHYSLNGGSGKLLLDGSETRLESAGVEQINMNLGRTGFYRTLYDDALYDVLAGTLNKLDQGERWGVVCDLYYFLLSGRVSLERYLRFVGLMLDDTGYIVVSGISSQLRRLREMVPENSSLSGTFMKYFSRQLERIGVDRKDGEDENSAVLREMLTEGLAMFDTAFADEHAKRFENIADQAPELRGSIGIAFARTMGGAAFDPLLNSMKNARSDADAMKGLLALTSFRDTESVKRTLDLAFSDQLNTGHIAFLVYMAADNPDTKSEVWKWFASNMARLFKTYAGTGMNSTLAEVTISRAGIYSREEVEQFFQKNRVPEADRGIAKGLELLSAYSRFREKYAK